MSKVIDRLEERKTAIELEVAKTEAEIISLQESIADSKEKIAFLDELIAEAKAIESSDACDLAEETVEEVVVPRTDAVLHFRD